MNAQHTQGRIYFRANGDANSYALLDANNQWVMAILMNGQQVSAQQAETLERMAACWNACDGVPTEVLEAQQSGGLPWSVADQIEQRVQFSAYKEGSEEAFGAVVDAKRKAEESASRLEQTIQSQHGVFVKMRAQRDKLLAALEVMLRDYTAVHDIGDVEMQPAIYQARAAIPPGYKLVPVEPTPEMRSAGFMADKGSSIHHACADIYRAMIAAAATAAPRRHRPAAAGAGGVGGV